MLLNSVMENSGHIVAKATSVEDQSDGIVVSFGVEWYQPLRDQKFKAVIRKRTPKTLKPSWLYFHVNAPVSAICARAPILAIRELKAAEANKRAADLALSPADVVAYIGSDATVGCYELGGISFASREITIAELTSRLVYHPPQSFFILSRTGKDVLDQLAGFGSRSLKKGGKR